MIKTISVAEYAQIKNISPQAVYKQISKKKLTVIYKEENNKKVKYIEVDLTESEIERFNNHFNNQIEKVENVENTIIPAHSSLLVDKEDIKLTEERRQEVKQPIERNDIEVVKPTEESKENSREKELLNQIEELNNRLKTAEKIIKDKDAQIIERDNKLFEYADKLAFFAEQSQEIARQALTTAGQAQILQAAGNEDLKELVKDTEKNKPKKTFWHKLFYWYEDY